MIQGFFGGLMRKVHEESDEININKLESVNEKGKVFPARFV